MTTLEATSDTYNSNPFQPVLDNTEHAAGQIMVERRTGDIVEYDENKIKNAMIKAFHAVEGDTASNSNRITEVVNNITGIISQQFHQMRPNGGVISIAEIQKFVEFGLMAAGQHEVATAYIVYRHDRQKERELKEKKSKKGKKEDQILVTYPDNTTAPLDEKHLLNIINEACAELKNVDAHAILADTKRNLFSGVSAVDVNKALVMCARVHIEKEPDYTYVSSRLLMNQMRNETLAYFGLESQINQEQLGKVYPKVFSAYIEKGIELDLLNPKLATFDLAKLGKAIQGSRDLQFTYLGLQTLYDRYFLHTNGTRLELPQVFFMRVAMGLALGEKDDKTERAIEFYNLLSSFDYMCSTPTLFNAGTNRPQLSSCFLTTIPDDLKGIYDAIRDNALLSKFAGGIGNDWTPVRGMGAHIKGTNGKSLGVVPFMNVADATAIAVNQGGKRKGAVCGYLETWHMDIEEFIELRKNTGDDRRRTHDMNTANWIPDLFVQRVFEDKEWTLFSPNDVPDLHERFGADFEKAYVAYEKKAAKGKLRCKTVKAVTLWRKMLGMLYETGHPWFTFKDACNIRSPQQHAGVIHSSNLCTEITLNTSKDEVAVCNLGSINLAQHVTSKGLDTKKLKKTITTAVRMLDNVIDINYYTVPQARKSNLRHRPVGMGIMGFQDALYKQRIPYASEAAVQFADVSMETISYYAIQSSSELAEERGCYDSYEGSLWSKGILPIDSIELLQEARGEYLEQDRSTTLDWDSLRTKVATRGMRNSNLLAIAPTATISNICGVSQSIEPTYKNLFVKSNMSGEFTVINPYLIADLKQNKLWDEVMINDLKYYDGDIDKIQRVPAELKKLYRTAFEIEPRWLIEAASRRQKWLDQAQSLNLYMAEPSGKKLDITYRMAWLRGLKTTYYLRSMGATTSERATVADGTLNAVKLNAPKACSIDDPDCEACQ